MPCRRATAGVDYVALGQQKGSERWKRRSINLRVKYRDVV